MGLAVSAIDLKARLELSKAKHRSVAGHARIARLVASLVPFYQYDEQQIFKADSAPDAVVAQRRADFARLADLYRNRYARTLGLTAAATEVISDLQFTEAYRVPFQFSRHVRPHLPNGDVYATLVYSCRGTDVRTVLVDGQVVVDDGRLLTLDVDAVRRDAIAAREAVVARAGLA